MDRLPTAPVRTDDTTCAVPFDGWDDEEHEVDERGVPMSSLPKNFVYENNFGAR